MLHYIEPYHFSNEYKTNFVLCPDNSSLLIVWKNGRILVKINDDTIHLPHALEMTSTSLIYLISIETTRFYLYLSKENEDFAFFADKGYTWMQPRDLRYLQPAWLRYGALVSSQLALWYEQNQYCGCCGGRTVTGREERSLICSACGMTVYPRINPCVIVAVTQNDKILLTKYSKNGTNAKYALVAGFCEIGETAEDTVVREVKEETGLTVKDIRFYKSQPWPFSSSLLFGFFCTAEGNAQPLPDGEELSVAEWVERENIPMYENENSLTYEMIDFFRHNNSSETLF